MTLPVKAVVAWHLLAEMLPRAEWRRVVERPQNLIGLLKKLKHWAGSQGKTGSKEVVEAGEVEGLEEVPAWWSKVWGSGFIDQYLQALEDLKPEQKYLLVHIATPPAVEVSQPEPTRKRRGILDLNSNDWIEIPGGTFLMGAQSYDPDAPGHDDDARDNESPVREVKISPFRIARYPVTNSDYSVYVQETGKAPPDRWEDGQIPAGKEEHPVVLVSWTDAKAFCGWLTQRLVTQGGDGSLEVRLPTEAEWEYTARGLRNRKYPWGADALDFKRANYGGNEGDTTPVGWYPEGTTPEGVHDLAGNVGEWCGDWFGPYDQDDREDPTGPSGGSSRCIRGGSFGFYPSALRGAFRNDLRPELRAHYIGFRVVLAQRAGS